MATLTRAMAALDFRLAGVGRGEALQERLRNVRQRRALSLDEVARRSGLARNTVRALEKGGGSVASLLKVLAVLAPRARRRSPERAYWGEGDKIDRDSRFTPPQFLEGLSAAFGDIDLDPCGHELSPVVARRRILPSEGGDGLAEPWSGRLAFVNPPYSELLTWLRRAHEQWRLGNVETVVCLVPVRTDSSWFHETLSGDADIFLLRGRVRFLSPDGRAQPTPFSLMVLSMGATDDQRRLCQNILPGFWLPRRSPPTCASAPPMPPSGKPASPPSPEAWRAPEIDATFPHGNRRET